MSPGGSSDDAQLKRALEINRIDAERGKDSFFKRWWFFDTNCISELVKMWGQGLSTQVQEFVAGRDVLITSNVVQELRKAPDILESLDVALEGARLFLVADMTKFWYTDFINFFNVDRIPMNSLEVYPAPSGFFGQVTTRRDFEAACLKAEQDVGDHFFGKIVDDIGSSLDERDLCIHIFGVVNRYANEWFKMDIAPADVHSGNLPSFYVFFYAYYFRYVKNRDVRFDLNDFSDLTSCLAAPYCERYYCEATFATILRNCVQGRIPPAALQLVKKTLKKGLVSKETYDDKRGKADLFGRTSPLLETTQVFTFAEMRSHILGGHAGGELSC